MRSIIGNLVNHISKRKITAMVLAAAMVVSTLYIGPSRADAADELIFEVDEDMTVDATTQVTASDGELHTFSELAMVTVNPGVTLTISGNVSCPDLFLNTCTLESEIVIASGATLTVDRAELGSTTTVNGTFKLNTLSLGDEETATLNNYGTVECSSFISNSSGIFNNYGTFIVPNFDSTSLYGPFTNESTGVVIADTVKMSIDYENPYANYLVNVQNGTENAAYRVTTSLTISGYNSQNIGDIYAEPDTLITMDGGGFYMTVGDKGPVLVSGDVSGAKASALLKQKPEFYDHFPTTILYGVPYDALDEDYIECTSDGTLSATYYQVNPEDPDSLILIGTTAPTEVGEYCVIYLVPETETFGDAEYSCGYEIVYLDETPAMCEISGTKAAEQYSGHDVYTGPVTFTAPDGYEIRPDFDEEAAFAETYVIEEDGLYEGLKAYYRRKSDGAVTELKDAYTSFFYINAHAPEISSVRDQDDEELDLNASNIYKANSAVVTLKDAINIKSVKVDGVLVTASESNGTEYDVTLALSGFADETFAIEVTNEYDMTANLSVTLQYAFLDTPDDPYTIDGTEGDNGYYTSDVVLRPADGYLISTELGGTYTATLDYDPSITEIWLKDSDTGRLTDSVAVEPILIDKQAPVIVAWLSRAGGDPVELNDGDDLNFKTMRIQVTDPEGLLTDFSINGDQVLVSPGYGVTKYIDADKNIKQTDELIAKDKAGNTTQITISYQDLRQDAEATLSVEDIEVGEELKPVLTTDHDAKDQVEYTYNDGIHDYYTDEVPTEVGYYEIRAYIPPSDTYNEIEIYEGFEILKKTPALSVTVPNTVYGEEYAPVVTNGSDATAKVEYKLTSEEDGSYSETKPSMPGKYTVRVSVVETEEYQARSVENTFEIKMIKDTTASVSIGEVKVGEDYEPTLVTASDGREYATFDYKGALEDDDQYNGTPPTAAGKYIVRATVPATATYEKIVVTASFSIVKRTPTKAVVTMDDIEVGDEVAPEVDTDSNGQKVLEYKEADADDALYDETPPSTAGTYKVRLTVLESETFEEISAEDEFTISKKTVEATVTVADCEVGDIITPIVTTTSDGKAHTTFEYKLESDPDMNYDGDPPTAAGTYMVRATVPETNTYNKIVCNSTFTISKKTPVSATVTVENIEWGGTITPVITSDSDGKDDPIFEYKLQSQGEDSYSGTEPTEIGDYDIRATLKETDNYYSISCTGSFSITKKTVTARVTVQNVEYGGTISPVIETESNGKADAEFLYKLVSDDESKYSGTVPTAVGEYNVRALIPETAKYFAIECEGSFKITKKTVVEATVTVADIYVDGTIKPVVETESTGKDDAEFAYKLTSEDESAYTGTEPTAAGEYDIRATIPATASYEEIICYGNFKIMKKTPVSATVTVADIEVGGELKPSVTTDSNGTPTYKYKLSSEDESAWTAEVPTAAGEYDIFATVAETAQYESITCTGSFKITKKTATYATVTVADIKVGGELKPSVTTDSNGTPSYKYKLSSEGEDAWDAEVPTAAGEYDILATIPETETFEATSCTGSFKITKKVPASASVTVADIKVGGELKPSVTTDSNGTPSYKYKLSSEGEDAWDAEVPTAAGEYDILATIAETETFEAASCTGSFKITKKVPASASVTVADIKVGGELKPSVTTDSNGTPSYKYKLSSEGEDAWDAEVPTAAGEYDICATISETATYEEIVCYGSFKITKKVPASAIVTVADIKVGENPDPSVTTDSNGTPSYTYKKKTDTTYSRTVPTAAGEYDICATISETATYEETVCYGSFKITKKVPTSASVTVADIEVDGTINPVVSTDSNGTPSYKYKLSSEDETAWDGNPPTAAGQYDILVTIAESEMYEATSCTGTFAIVKKKATYATVTVADIEVGGKLNPVVSTDSNGTPSYTYKKKTASVYSATVPTEAGEYDIRATIGETEQFESISCTGSFSIVKKKATYATVTVADIKVGGELKPSVTTDSNGTPSYKYKLSSEGEDAWDAEVPTAAGEYDILVTIPETETFEATSCTGSFKITKKTATYATVTVADIKVGGELKPSVTTDSNGTPSYKYKLSSEGEDAWDAEVPTAAGEYDILATIAETETFEATSCTGSFKITKKTPASASVTVADIKVGGELKPSVTTDSNGTPSYKYKLSSEGEDAWDAEVPTAAGEYDILATIPETETFEATSCMGSFKITKKTATYATVTVADIKVGGELKPSVTTDSNGTPSYKYKLSSEGEDAWDAEVPTAAGEYDILATIPETETFEATSCTGSFKITKKTATYATVTVADIKVGGELKPSVTTDSNGTPSYKYKLSSEGEDAWDAEVPTAAGEYDILATIAETETFEATSCTGSFKITKKTPASASVTVADIKVGGELKPSVTTDSNGTPSYKYKLSSEGEDAWDAEVPTAAGEYDILVTIPETETFEATSCTGSFKITKKTATYATVTVADIKVGGELKPSVTTDSNGTPSYKYKLSSEGEDAWDAEVPTAAGEYDILATIAETETFEATSCTGSFKITKKTPASASVTVADIKVGGELKPSVTTDSNGTPSYKYKLSSEGEDAWDAEVPTAAGEYDILATIPETETFEATSCTGSFKITKKTATYATVTVADIKVGGELKPSVTTDSNGTPSYKYKLSSEGEDAWDAEVPTAAGEYDILATIAETETFEATSCTGSFKITRKIPKLEITIGGDIELDQKLYVNVDTDSNGKPEYAYKKYGDPDTAYQPDQPNELGEYVLRVSVPMTATYEAASTTESFVILKKTDYPDIDASDVEYGEALDVNVHSKSDGLKRAKYEYKKKSDPVGSYSDETKPTEVGEYSVRVTIPETDTFYGNVLEATFKIVKAWPDMSLEVENVEFGKAIKPEFTTNSDGGVTYLYKRSDEADSQYKNVVPTDVGTYNIKVVTAETTHFRADEIEKTFRITKTLATASVTVADIEVDGKLAPKVTTTSDGTATFTYKKKTDSTYTATVPTAAGEYDICASIPETANFEPVVCYGSFKIVRKTATASVSVVDIEVDGKLAPKVTTTSNGTATFTYKKKTDSAYTATVPTAAGEYDICASIPETAKFKPVVCYGSFKIIRKTATASVSVADIEVGGKLAPKVTTTSNGTAAFTYKKKTDSAYTATVPTAAGEYDICASIPETAKFKPVVCYGSFRISKKAATVTVSIGEIFAGTNYAPSASSNSYGAIIYEFKENKEGAAYSGTKPMAAGSYVVRATVLETDTYLSASAEKAFRISYLSKPGEDCEPEGEEGENGYYTSDVWLDAPDGYLISASKDGEYTTRIPYTEGMRVYYLQRKSDGALTDTVQLAAEIKIDKLTPEAGSLVDQDGNPINTNGLSYADRVKFTISDDNLASVTVNGKPVNVVNHTAEVVLDPMNDTVTFKIIAKDLAGNMFELGVTIAAAWIREGVVPAGTPLPLKTGKQYTMAAGKWTTDSSDGMTYTGNRKFYVRVSKNYTFNQSK